MMLYERGMIVLVNDNPQKKAEEVEKVYPAIIVSDTMLNDIRIREQKLHLVTQIFHGTM